MEKHSRRNGKAKQNLDERLHCGGLEEALVYLKKNITKVKNVDPQSFLFISQKVIVTGNSAYQQICDKQTQKSTMDKFLNVASLK